MGSKQETDQGSKADTFKLVLALGLIVAAAIAFYVYAEQSLLMRVLALLAVAGISIFIALQTDKGRNTWAFIGSTRTEVRKVIWPTRTETMQTTLVVILMVILVGIILWLMDTVLLWAVKLLTGQGD